MPSTFFGLEIAKRALAVSQLNLQVIAHNIANSSTPGYSRQRAELVPAAPLAYPAFTRPGYVQQMGSGVDVNAIKRLRDEFLDEVIWGQTSSQGHNTAVESALNQIQQIFNEPSDTGLSTALDNFFATWQDLANNPELVSSRANLREQAFTLVRTISTLGGPFRKLIADQNSALRLKVKEVNDLAEQISDLNVQISEVRGLGDNPNDLMDQRDQLVEKMASIVPATVIEDSNNRTSVLIGGLRIVEEDLVQKINLVSGPNGPDDLELRIGTTLIPELSGKGELAGIMEAREEVIPFFQSKLDNLISAVVNRVNVIHLRGFGLDGVKSRPFFADYHTAEMVGTAALPAGTTEDTPLDELGITAGNFLINGTNITILESDVAPGEAIALGDLLKRITDAQPLVRASLSHNIAGQPLIRLDLYNPPTASTEIEVTPGTSNFPAMTGLDTATTEFLETVSVYGNASGMIGLSLPVRENLDAIAAAGDDGSGIYPGPGNNDNAIAIAGLQSSNTSMVNTSFGDYYVAAIGELGSRSRAATQLVTNQSILLNQLNTQRESVKGVNMDEEATNMIIYQRIYEGAARVSQVVDSMLDTLINRTGA